MLKFLKGVVGSGTGIKDLPFSIGEPYSTAWGSWIHYRGSSKDDNSPVSLFAFTGTSFQDSRLAAARNGAKRLRTVRHPNILSYVHSTEAEAVDGGITKATVYVVTEPVMPLTEKLKELNLKGTQRDEFFACGLHQVTKAVSFLNNDCKLVHGNVCLDAVVVTPTLDWKLHAFDILSEFDGGNPGAMGPMLQYESLVAPQYKCQELAKTDWATIRRSSPWAIDSWGLGCLIYELFSGSKLSTTENLRNIQSIPKTLLPDYQRLLGSVPSRRMNPSKLIENSEFFQNKLVETIQFMEVLNLKDSVEKDSFFRKLSTLIEHLPREIVIRKLLPLLASALEFGSAAAPALNPLLKMGSWLSQDEFNVHVLPTVIKLFASNDRAIRVSLLQNVENFGSGLSTHVVDEQVFPHLATGFSDSSAFLREATLKSMLTLAPKLSQRTVTGSLLKYLSKLQVDEEPAIRTNTTILLGNIAGHLSEATRKRVLINAFTIRALRDGFAPARGAGIMALMATTEYYDATEIATRILPHLVVLTVDGDSDVRTKAFQATESFLQAIRQHHEKVAVGEGGLTGFSNPSTKVGLLGWAVSSLTAAKAKSETSTAASLSSEPSSSLNKIIAVPERLPLSPVAVLTTSNQDEKPAVVSPTSDAWGDMGESENLENEDDDMEGWGGMDLFEEPALGQIQAAQVRPVYSQQMPSTKPHSTTVVSNVKVNKETDTSRTTASIKSQDVFREDDDPWAAIAAPPPSSSAKPLNLGSSTVSGRVSVNARIRQTQHVSTAENVSVEKPYRAQLVNSSGRSGSGRGRAAAMKLGAQRVSRQIEEP